MTREIVFYTVYERPTDYPNEYVIRCHRARDGGWPVPDSDLFARGLTVEYVKSCLPPGLAQIGPHPDDDPSILEVWVLR